jgi:hypothetical protein
LEIFHENDFDFGENGFENEIFVYLSIWICKHDDSSRKQTNNPSSSNLLLDLDLDRDLDRFRPPERDRRPRSLEGDLLRLVPLPAQTKHLIQNKTKHANRTATSASASTASSSSDRSGSSRFHGTRTLCRLLVNQTRVERHQQNQTVQLLAVQLSNHSLSLFLRTHFHNRSRFLTKRNKRKKKKKKKKKILEPRASLTQSFPMHREFPANAPR